MSLKGNVFEPYTGHIMDDLKDNQNPSHPITIEVINV